MGREPIEGQLFELLAERAPQRIRARLEDPVRAFGDAVLLRTVEGRLLDARIGRLEGPAALTVLALAEAVTFEVGPEQPSSSRVGPSFRALWTDARSHAAQVTELLEPLGGLEAHPRSTGARASGLPEAALEILALVDGRRTGAAILAASPHDFLLTARILVRLFEVEALVVPPLPVEATPVNPPSFVPPTSGWGQSSLLPSEDEEVEGEAAVAEVQAWLGPNASASLSTGEAFRSVFYEEETPTPVGIEPPRAPIPRAPSASSSAPPNPIPARPPGVERTEGALDGFGRRVEAPSIPDADDEALAKEAGVSQAPLLVVLLAVVGIAIAALIFALGREPPPPPPAPPPPPPPPVVTATVAKTSTRAPEIIDGRPAIAGPDAPVEVKRAEQLLNRGAYREAEQLLDELKKTFPSDPAVLTLAGQLYVDTRRLGPAGEAADAALAADPKFYRAWVLKGSVAQFKGQAGAARTSYQKAIALEPQHPMSPEIQSVLASLGQ
ncbi:MAG: hypothetical protein IPG45_10230 [Deltaproteobacteria bacterium]|nr:hypothetical protein [Deltaproteobacteria bacterium]